MKRFLLIPALIIVCFIMMSRDTYAAAGRWVKDNNGWWYSLNSGGYCRNEWMQDDDGSYYYFNNDGYMLSNTWVGDYYLGIYGAMIVWGNTPDGYFVDDDGKWKRDVPKWDFPVLSGRYKVSLTKNNGYNSGVDRVGLNINTFEVSGFYINMGNFEGNTYTPEFYHVLFYVDKNTKYYTADGEREVAMTKDEFSRVIDEYGGATLELEILNNTVIKAYYEM